MTSPDILALEQALAVARGELVARAKTMVRLRNTLLAVTDGLATHWQPLPPPPAEGNKP